MRTTQRKGDIAASQAIATFTKLGWDVSIPLTESAAYDLIVDNNISIFRVQVKYTSTGEVDLRNIHTNSTGYVVKKNSHKTYDWLYILRSDGKEFVIEDCLINRRSVKPVDSHSIQRFEAIAA